MRELAYVGMKVHHAAHEVFPCYRVYGTKYFNNIKYAGRHLRNCSWNVHSTDNVPYRVTRDGTLRLLAPVVDIVFQKSHAGVLVEVTFVITRCTASLPYWWDDMRRAGVGNVCSVLRVT